MAHIAWESPWVLLIIAPYVACGIALVFQYFREREKPLHDAIDLLLEERKKADELQKTQK